MKATIVSLTALFAITSAVASPLKPRCSDIEVFPTLDDTNSGISYSAGWTKISGKSQDTDGVEAYNNAPCANYSMTVPITGGSFEIKCGQKVDRGYFDVYVNDDNIGRGDAYSSDCTSNCPSTVVFTGILSVLTNENATINPAIHTAAPAMSVFKPDIFAGKVVFCTGGSTTDGICLYLAHVNAAKAGIEALLRVAAIEFGPFGVRFNTIAPGPIEGTEGVSRLMPTDKDGLNGGAKAIPMQRLGQRDDVANSTIYMFSSAASHDLPKLFRAYARQPDF
ncbi:MAG: hypothetical protein CYPHOPRED_002421 [Cyphobasidiales sp. Tagirdzhanova-0007]|nr:MAG: hypothetical protein CYPHOPRED_002421 [Cyphobasidiales sp. Tagirdzhanova-0007]